MRRHLIIYLITLVISVAASAQNLTRISGNVRDESGNVLPYVTVRLKDTSYGCTTDNKGNFSFMGPSGNQTLLISSIGYSNVEISLTASVKYPLQVRMASETYSLSEVEVKPGREHYSRRDNPAVDLVRQLIEKKEDEDPDSHEFWSRHRYERLNIAMDDFNEKKRSRAPYNRFDFLDEYIDTSLVSGMPILNVSTREKVATDYYSRSPMRRKQHIEARNWAGIDDFMMAGDIQAAVEGAVTDIDIFDDKISIFRREFPSPLARSVMSTNYYKYYIIDTVSVGGELCTDLSFVPFNPESFGFTGHIYVTCDSALFIKWVQMGVPYDINMNFVQYMDINQKFERDAEHPRLLVEESLSTVLKPYDVIDGLYVRRVAYYSGYRFDDQVDKEIFSRPEIEIEDDASTERSDEYWAEQRSDEETMRARAIKEMVARLRENKLYHWTERGIAFLFSGYIPVKDKKTPYYYGPLNTTASYNGLEGLRLRTGGMTTAWLNPKLFLRWYVAYGTQDQKLKGMGNLEYSFVPKKESYNEFPIRSLTLHHEYDIFQYGQTFNYTNKDNFVLSLRRKADDKTGYLRNSYLTFTYEWYSGFSVRATLRNRCFMDSRLISFDRVMPDGSTLGTHDFSLTDLELKLRYAPGEKFVQMNWNRHTVTPEKPVFTLTHSISHEGILGSDYSVQTTEAEYRQRIFITPFGYLDAVVKGGKVWDQVPYPLLTIPNANLALAMRKESFELMNPMEFVLDSYAQWDVEYSMNGFIFNRLPLLKKLELREVITTRGIWGTLSDRNNPAIDRSGNIFKFPEQAIAAPMGNTPYTEIGFGIENIFKVLRVDYYRRLTHKNTPGVSTQGVRIAVHVEF